MLAAGALRALAMSSDPAPPLNDLAYYEDLRSVRRRVAESLRFRPGAQLLDVGSGNGGFSLALARAHHGVRVDGADRVGGYLAVAARRAHESGLSERCSFHAVDYRRLLASRGGYDAATFFLSLSEIARVEPLASIASLVHAGLRSQGQIVLVDVLPERLSSPRERAGIRLHQAVGYRYFSERELIDSLRGAGFEVGPVRSFEAGGVALDERGIGQFIADECRFNHLEGNPEVDETAVRSAFGGPVEVVIDATLHCVIGVRA